jgi:hypothetical protein
MSATSPEAPLVFGNLTSDIFKVHVLGNNVRISGPLLAKEIPNLVFENYRAKKEKHAGTKKSGSRVWTLEYRNSLPFHVEISPKTSFNMREGKYPGQIAHAIANNRDAQEAERFARDDQATAIEIQKSTEVVAEVLVKVNSTKTVLQELHKTQAVLLEKVTKLTQMQAHSESMSQESALTRQLESPTEPVTGANDPTGPPQSEDDLAAADRDDASEHQKRPAIELANDESDDESHKKHKGVLPQSAFSESASATAAPAAGKRATESTPIGSLPQAPARPPALARTAAPAGTGNTRRVDLSSASSGQSDANANARTNNVPGPVVGELGDLLGSSGPPRSLSQSKDTIGTSRMFHIQRDESDDLIPDARKLFCGPHCGNCKKCPIYVAHGPAGLISGTSEGYAMTARHKGLYSGTFIGPDMMQTLHLTRSQTIEYFVRDPQFQCTDVSRLQKSTTTWCMPRNSGTVGCWMVVMTR